MLLRRVLAAFVVVALPLSARAGMEEPPTFPLWPEGAPGAVGTDKGDANHAGDVPTITVHLAPKDKATGAAIVICPGGGYGFLATDHEGVQPAKWLNSLGVAAVVLKYRLAPRYRHPAPLDDVRRAIRTVRMRAGEWGLDVERVGVMGFSAGGHLASTAATQFRVPKAVEGDPTSSFDERPNVAILVYPVITLSADFRHKGSATNLLGPDATQEQLAAMSSETRVTNLTPPTFLVHTLADTAVPVENSLAFAAALRKHGVPFELHVFEKGRHGLGLGGGEPKFNVPAEPTFAAWPALCATWLKTRGFLDRH